MQDSIFTKIIKGEIPCHKVYEDEHTLAFMDINPAQPGHVVVVPKVQVDSIWDLEKGAYQALMNTVQKVGQQMRNVFADKARVGVIVEGFGVANHAHVNVFPFSSPQELRHLPPEDREPDHAALAEIAQKLAF